LKCCSGAGGSTLLAMLCIRRPTLFVHDLVPAISEISGVSERSLHSEFRPPFTFGYCSNAMRIETIPCSIVKPVFAPVSRMRCIKDAAQTVDTGRGGRAGEVLADFEQAGWASQIGGQASSCSSAAFTGSRGLPVRVSSASARFGLTRREAPAQPEPQRLRPKLPPPSRTGLRTQWHSVKTQRHPVKNSLMQH